MSLAASLAQPAFGAQRRRYLQGSKQQVCRADIWRFWQARASKSKDVTGIVFQPFEEVQPQLAVVSKTEASSTSFARVDYHPECEAAVNEQVNVEYTISYVYDAIASYFDRDNVGLPGFAKFFNEASDEERGHARKLMAYQNTRGGRVKLQSLVMPEMEFGNAEKGEALYAMELALSLEKLNFVKLRALHDVACKHNDAALADYIEGELLQEQVESVKQHAVYVSQLRRIGKGHAVWHFDKELA